MSSLEYSSARVPSGGWSLDELVDAANALLPEFLPAAADRPNAAGKVREEVNTRLVRHYASLGLLDENVREGREARYGFRHLLQLLLVRRLLTEGYPAAVIVRLLAGKTDSELRALLHGGANVSATPANPVLDFLAGVRRRAGLSSPAAPPASPAPPAAAPVSPASGVASPVPAVTGAWTRAELLPGLEIHVRDGFNLPASQYEREALSQWFLDTLRQLTRSTSSRRSRPKSL